MIIAIFMISSCKMNITNEEDETETGTVTDIDGNVYETVKIGNQWWMAENLKVYHYRNEDAIPLVISDSEWENLTTGARCDRVTYIYGRLYNWHAVNDSRNIAPEGWHVPSDAEWYTLIDYLGENASDKMKIRGDSYWLWPNSGTNESGFTALPAGFRNSDGSYNPAGLGFFATFWSSTEYDSTNAWYCLLQYNTLPVSIVHSSKQCGFSVRCIKD